MMVRPPSDLSLHDRAGMLYDFFAGEGVRSVAPKFGLETVGCMRQIMKDVRSVSYFIDQNLRGGTLHLGSVRHTLDFGDEWQSDGKVIRVTRIFAENNPVYRRRDFCISPGRTTTLYDIYNENVLEKRHHNILASLYLPNNASRYVSRALDWAQYLTGKNPDNIEVDNKMYASAVRRKFGGQVLLIVMIKRGEAGQLKILEGYHRYQDRKIESSIHGKSIAILDGLRIHYNFCARKDRLGRLTPMEHAGLPRLDERNTWLPLLTHAEDYSHNNPPLKVTPWDRNLPTIENWLTQRV